MAFRIDGARATKATPIPPENRDSHALEGLPALEWKRRLDVVCILCCLPLILPLMALIASWIKMVSKESILLRQKRIGRGGKPFELYKFRCMKTHVGIQRQGFYMRHLVKSGRPMIKMDTYCESGLIVGGHFLRVSGLDELPQLWNVLRGEMSLVGPRPCLPSEYAWYSTPQKERFNGLPGLTGYWQVNGKNQLSFHEMNAMDVYYVRHASILMDLHIMLRTPVALLFQSAISFRHQFAVMQGLRYQGFICGANQEYAHRGYKRPL